MFYIKLFFFQHVNPTRYTYCADCCCAWEESEGETSLHPSHKGHTLPFAGITLIPEFVTETEEAELDLIINSTEWTASQSGRRKQASIAVFHPTTPLFSSDFSALMLTNFICRAYDVKIVLLPYRTQLMPNAVWSVHWSWHLKRGCRDESLFVDVEYLYYIFMILDNC